MQLPSTGRMPRLLAASLALVVVLGMAVSPSDAAEALESPETTLDQTTLPLIGVNAEGGALGAAEPDGQFLDPASTTFTVDASGRAVSRIAFHDRLPAVDMHVSTSLSLRIVQAPADSDVTATVSSQGFDQEWSATAPEITLAGQEAADVSWAYDHPGDYVLKVTARTTIDTLTSASGNADSAAEPTPREPGADAPAEVSATETQLTPVVNFYKVRVDGPAPDTGTDTSETQGDSAGSSSQVSLESLALDSGPSKVVVLDSGEVAFAPRVEDGVLKTSLLYGEEYLPTSTTVLHVPNQDTEWPGVHANGDPQNTALWDEVVASGVRPWRTTGIPRAWQRNPLPQNDLIFTISGEFLEAPTESSIDFVSADTESGSRFAVYGETGFSSRANLNWETGRATWGTALASNRFYIGVLGESAGVYCFTVDSSVGDQTRRDTLTFVMGDLPAGNDYLCERGDESDPEEPIDPKDPTLGENVVNAGEVRISPNINDWSLGLRKIDSSGNAGEWKNPTETVLWLPEQDQSHPSLRNLWWGFIYPSDDLAYRTTGQPLGTRNSVANDLAISFDNGGVPVPVDFALRKTTTTVENGYFASYRSTTSDSTPDPGSFPVWDSRPTGVNRNLMTTEGNAERSGWLFSQPGTYCLTFSADLTGYFGDTFYSTFTVVVGDHPNPGDVEMCQPPETMDDDHIQYPDNGVSYLDRGHLDIGVLDMGNGPGLGIKVGGARESVAFEDAVLVGNKPHNRRTAASGAEFIAPAGSEYWYFTLESQADYTLWPGWAFVLNGQTKGPATWSVVDVTAPGGGERPGDMVVYLGHEDVTRGNANSILFSTKRGLPESVGSVNDHVHTNWAFTTSGVYCVSLEARWQMQDGERQSDRNILTIAVGDDVDPTTVVPCTESIDEPYSASPLEDLGAVDPGEGRTVQAGTVSLTPFVDAAGKAQLYSAHRADATAAPSYYESDEIVYSTSRQATSTAWEFGRYEAGSNPNLNLDSRYLESTGAVGDASIEFGEASGPGVMKIEREGFGLAFDSSKNDEQRAALFPGWFEQNTLITFTAKGTYCLPITMTVPMAGGGQVTTSKTLTFVAGGVGTSRDVKLCSEGGEGTEPGDGGEDPDQPAEWNVPNGSATQSGATIINSGHVDIASQIENGRLVTRIKDDTTGNSQPVFRKTGDTVLQILPYAKTTVQSPAQSFIAAVGDTIWQVTETPQSGLLWPGWSTERVPLDATTGGVNWKLNAVDGPGEVAVFANGAQRVYFNTKDGITAADQFESPKNTHTHANWTFTAEGVYCMAWERTATSSTGQRLSDSFVTVFAVGEVNVRDIDPGKCFTEPAGKPDDGDRGKAPTDLNESNANDVQVLGNDTSFTPGQLVTVQVGAAYAGDWVSAWIGQQWVGWAHVGDSGAIQIRIPTDLKPGTHRLAVTDRDGGLIGWDSISVVAAKAPPGGVSTPAPDGQAAVQTRSAEQCVAGVTILSAGHIDYASRIVGGKLESLIGDDTSGTKVYREPSGTVLWLKPEARNGGVWQIPQTQNGNLVWLGWSTEALNAGNARGNVQWTINSIDGPGTVQVYTSGVFGGVQEMVFNNGGSKNINLGVHAHANWDFSAEGMYRISTTQTVTLANGQRSSDTETLTIAVGNVDPASAAPETSGSGCGVVSNAMLLSDDHDLAQASQSAEQAAAEAAKAARDRLPGDRQGTIWNPFEEFASGNPVPLLLTVLGALLSTGAAGSGVLWWRRRKLGAL